MTVEIALVISIISAVFGVYSAVTSTKRANRIDSQKDTSLLTTVIVRLDNISASIAEMKADRNNSNGEIKDLRDRLIVVEQSVKQCHKRIDALEKKGETL